MKRPSELKRQETDMQTLVQITGIFESIASMRIAKVKNQVERSTQFFDELWHIYSQLRVDSSFHFGRDKKEKDIIDRELYIAITAEGGFSGDIDQKLIHLLLEGYNADKHDIFVIGHHGAVQLAQRGVSFQKYFKLPTKDQNINVTPIVKDIQRYRSTTVFYEEYVSLMSQNVKQITLSSAVQELGGAADKAEEVISEKTYLFEPSTFAVVGHLERSMIYIALSQLILESKLAQYASRFRAMSQAYQRAGDSRDELLLLFNRARRSQKDERLKEIINSIRQLGVTQ